MTRRYGPLTEIKSAEPRWRRIVVRDSNKRAQDSVSATTAAARRTSASTRTALKAMAGLDSPWSTRRSASNITVMPRQLRAASTTRTWAACSSTKQQVAVRGVPRRHRRHRHGRRPGVTNIQFGAGGLDVVEVALLRQRRRHQLEQLYDGWVVPYSLETPLCNKF